MCATTWKLTGSGKKFHAPRDKFFHFSFTLYWDFNWTVLPNPLNLIPSKQHRDNTVHLPLSLLIERHVRVYGTQQKKGYSLPLMQPRSLRSLAWTGGSVMFLSGSACYMKTTAWILYILHHQGVCFCFFWFNMNFSGCGQKWGWFYKENLNV